LYGETDIPNEPELSTLPWPMRQDNRIANPKQTAPKARHPAPSFPALGTRLRTNFKKKLTKESTIA
jgi:hypothetical protein